MRGKTPRFVDKLPVNYMNIGLILAALPNARIVHLVGSAMDTGLPVTNSCLPTPTCTPMTSRKWPEHHAPALMGTGDRSFRAESSTSATGGQDVGLCRALIDALGLPAGRRLLEFHLSQGVATASAGRFRPPTPLHWPLAPLENELQPMVRILETAGVPPWVIVAMMILPFWCWPDAPGH